MPYRKSQANTARLSTDCLTNRIGTGLRAVPLRKNR